MILKVLLWIFVLYLLSIIINTALLIYSYKVSHNKSVTVEYIFLEFFKDFKDSDGDSSFIFFMVAPGINILFIFYSLIFLGYSFIRNIRI